MTKQQSIIRRYTRIGATTLAALTIPLLVACSSPQVDPAATRDAVAEAIEEPSVDSASVTDETYDFALHPEPMVEPLECTPYLVVTVRGTGEPTKGQLLSPVAREISKARPDEVTQVDLDYPADTEVREGGSKGVRVLLDTLRVQSETCGDEQSYILLGYSQGALVIGDALSAPEDRMVGVTAGEVPDEAAAQVRSIVMYGNPRFQSSEKYDFGTYKMNRDGVFPRREGALTAYENRIRDFCVDKDLVCQSAFDATEDAHIEYFDNGMQQDGTAFVVSRLDPAKPKPKKDAKSKSGQTQNDKSTDEKSTDDKSSGDKQGDSPATENDQGSAGTDPRP
ncbi:cutinase family protein [Leucobacter sp. cx-328]|uniref:cutinase family protein n=1 Tax=unclassified Leucobacter TaxID=2621730 RepID=UPI00165DC396|nr:MULTISPECIES: cutinase family protein [unclassified Leucobacter]MBC9943914.1 cutinase family protein [Leucobacter sp. cx-328]